VGRPDALTVLAALAAVADKIGLTGTINSTFNEPYELVRQLASLDHLSGGRTAWNVVTSWDAFTGENFRRGGYLAQDQRYDRAKTFLQTALELFDASRGDEIVADQETGIFLSDPAPGCFEHRDRHFDIRGQLNVTGRPPGPPGHPPGRGLRGRPRVRRLLRGRDLLAPLPLRGRQVLLRGCQAAPRSASAHAAS
jgi:alkanesulfonate monooxygenase SsuD/methylene tetrahydromethanopterin reductase-like flavin-dependent oxidoreductase (luciferase family)